MGKWRDRFGGTHEGSPEKLLDWAGDELPEYAWMHMGEHGAWTLLAKAGGVLGFDPTGEGAKFAPPQETPKMGATPYFFAAANSLFAWDVQPRWVLREIPDPRKVGPEASAA